VTQQSEELPVVRRLAQFVLHRQTDELRGELHEFLVGMAAVVSGTGAAMSEEEIANGVEILLGLKGFPVKPLREAIASMVLKGDILSQDLHGKIGYLLSADKRNELASLDSGFSKLRAEVEAGLIEHARRKGVALSKSKQFKLVKSMYYALAHVCVMSSSGAVVASFGGDMKTREALSQSDLPKLVEESVNVYFDGTSRRAMSAVILGFLSKPSDSYMQCQTAITSWKFFISTPSARSAQETS